MATLQEQFNRQFNDSLKLLFDLTSRMEERIKVNTDNQKNMERILDDIREDLNLSSGRLLLIEAEKVQELKKQVLDAEKTILLLNNDSQHVKETIIELEKTVREHSLDLDTIDKKSTDTESKLGKIIDYVWKLGFLLLSGYIYYKFGWNN